MRSPEASLCTKRIKRYSIKEKCLLRNNCLRDKINIKEAAELLKILGNSTELDIIPPKYIKRNNNPKNITPKMIIESELFLNIRNLLGSHSEHMFQNLNSSSKILTQSQDHVLTASNETTFEYVNKFTQSFSEFFSLPLSSELERGIKELDLSEEAVLLLQIMCDLLSGDHSSCLPSTEKID